MIRPSPGGVGGTPALARIKALLNLEVPLPCNGYLLSSQVGSNFIPTFPYRGMHQGWKENIPGGLATAHDGFLLALGRLGVGMFISSLANVWRLEQDSL